MALNPSSALFPLIYLFGAWAVNYLFGFMSLEYPKQSSLARDAGSAVVLPLLTALLWWGKLVSTSFAVKALSYVASHRRSRNITKLAKTFEHIIYTNLKKFRLIIFVCACLIAFSYLYWEGVFAPIENQEQQSQYRYVLLLQALPFWFCIINFFVSLVVVFQISKIYITKYLRVRLFEIEELSPLCNVVVVYFLISFLAVTTYTINGIFFVLPDVDIYILFFSCSVLAFFLFSPIFLVQKVLKNRKEIMLERINNSLNEQMLMNTNGNSYRRLVDDETRLQFISDLLIVRKEVNQAPLWPMSVPFTVKIILILMLPILSWMGAGVVSQSLKVLLA